MKLFKDWEGKVCAVIFSVMLAIVFVNVISRYILHASLSYTEELVTVLFVLLSTLGGASAASSDSHYTLALIVDMVPPKWKKALLLLADVLSIVACLLLLFTGLKMMIQQFGLGSRSYALKIPEWIYGSFVPIGCGVMAFRFAQRTIARLKDRRD